MKFNLLLTLVLTSFVSLAQVGKMPKNIAESVVFLVENVPDSIKVKVVNGKEDDAYENFDANFIYRLRDLIVECPARDGVVQYLDRNRVISEITRFELFTKACKQYLEGKKIDEKSLLKTYQMKDAEILYKLKHSNAALTIGGIYIPKNIFECMTELDKLAPKELQESIAKIDSNDLYKANVAPFNNWVIELWRLDKKSRLNIYFAKYQVVEPFAMAGIIFKEYHRHLKKYPLDFTRIVEKYKSSKEQEYQIQKENLQRDIERFRPDFEKFKVNDTVIFNYEYGYVSFLQKEYVESKMCWAKGLVLNLDSVNLKMKVKFLSACEIDEIIWFRNDVNTNYTQKEFNDLNKRDIRYMKIGEVNTFNWFDWSID